MALQNRSVYHLPLWETVKIVKISSLPIALLFLVLTVLISAPGSSDAVEQENEEFEMKEQSVAYLTVRNETGNLDPEDWYGDERDSMHAGQCTFSLASLSLLKPLSRNGWIYIPENLKQLESVTEVNESLFWPEFKLNAQGKRPLLYVHGYNTSFAKACDQAALFQANFELDKRLILFSWPSDGSMINYTRDEADVYWRVVPLVGLLTRMVEEFGAGGFDVVAHSLGTRVLFLALVQAARKHQEVIPLLNQLVLTGADIDVGVFKQYLDLILPLAGNITVYASDNDRPLAISQEFHGYPRVGQSGAHLDDIKGIDVIDITDVGVSSFSGHLYHLYHDSVRQDLDLLLSDGLRADQRETLAAGVYGHWRLKQEEIAK